MNDSIKFLKAISDETRLAIIELLISGERCVCEIFPKLKVKQSTTSTHLNKLEEAGIIKSRREGKKVFYKIVDERVINVLRIVGNKKARESKLKCCCD